MPTSVLEQKRIERDVLADYASSLIVNPAWLAVRAELERLKARQLLMLTRLPTTSTAQEMQRLIGEIAGLTYAIERPDEMAKRSQEKP